MYNTRKRSLSPQSIDRSSESNGLKKIWSFFTRKPNSKQVKFNDKYEDVNPPSSNDDIISDKRRKLSIQQTQQIKSSIPRASVDHSKSINNYADYLSKFNQENDEVASTLERRATLIPNDEDVERYTSPIPDMAEVRRQSMQMIHNVNPELVDNVEDDLESDSGLLEFAPTYQDEDGNLIRPPIINLDPRERYQLLKLKRSIELSRNLQMKLKYTLNPNETNSVLLDNDKVETSTQTQNPGYLRKKLHYSDLLIKKSDRDVKKRKLNSGAVFSGEFFYEIDENKHEKADKFNGYLATVSKPQFKNTTPGRKELSQETKISLDPDYVSKTEKLSDIIKISDDQSKKKASVEPSQGFKFSVNKTDLHNIINKRKEDDQLVESNLNVADKSASQDKPAFNFGVSTKPSESKPEPKTESPKFSFGEKGKPETPRFPLDDKKKDAPKFSFGNTDKADAPKFNFGNGEKRDAPKFSLSEKTEAPKFSFGNTVKTEAPKFSLGGTVGDKNEPPKSDFGATNTQKPAFSFGANKNTDKPAEPKLNFGQKHDDDDDDEPRRKKRGAEPETKESEKPAPVAFNFNPKPSGSEAPKFSFGSSKDKDDSRDAKTPNFSIGGTSSEAPKLSSGAKPETNTDKTDSSDKPAFSFGNSSGLFGGDKRETSATTEAKDKPAFSFGGSSGFGASKELTTEPVAQASKPLFGGISTTSSVAGDKAGETPKFSFGGAAKQGSPSSSVAATIGDDRKETTPSFSFGNPNKDSGLFSNAAKKDPTPTFSFGATKDSGAPSLFGDKKPTSGFSFGAPGEKKENSAPAATAGPSLFGKSSAPATPSFNFGGAGKEAPKSSSPSFNFGATLKPSLNFGTTTMPSFGNTPAPAVASPFGLNKPAASAPIGNSPFQFGAVEKPTIGGTPFSKETTPNANPANVFGNPNNANPGFQFANGITPLKPSIPMPSAGFNKDATPGQFGFGNISRSNTNTPEFPGFGGGMGQNNGGMNATAMNFNNTAPGGMNGVNPLNATARPNRKIARMRKRRT